MNLRDTSGPPTTRACTRAIPSANTCSMARARNGFTSHFLPLMSTALDQGKQTVVGFLFVVDAKLRLSMWIAKCWLCQMFGILSASTAIVTFSINYLCLIELIKNRYLFLSPGVRKTPKVITFLSPISTKLRTGSCTGCAGWRRRVNTRSSLTASSSGSPSSQTRFMMHMDLKPSINFKVWIHPFRLMTFCDYSCQALHTKMSKDKVCPSKENGISFLKFYILTLIVCIICK